MGFTLGIVGLPNVGKSTLFNALSKAHAAVSNYPFCTIDPNVAVVPVPDERLQKIASFMKSPKIVHTSIDFFDIAGLVKGAHSGEGLGNKFLSHIRSVDAIAHVVRVFKDPNVVHVSGQVDPIADIEIVNTELILSDLDTIDKKLSAVSATAKSGNKQSQKEESLFLKIKDLLGRGQPARNLKINPEEESYLKDAALITRKPVLYVVNTDESLPGRPASQRGEQAGGNQEEVDKIKKLAATEGAEVIAVCAKLEADIGELSAEEAQEYVKEVGIKEMGLHKLISAGYKLLDLITFFTANQKQAHAWTVRNGAPVPEAAGKVHSDMQKGFISSDMIHYNDLGKCSSHADARTKGVLRQEGKNYIVQDGDLLQFKFNI